MAHKIKTGLIPTLDFGHGGMIAGQYQTAGKRSPDWELGILYEGASNRWFGWNIMRKLDSQKIPYYCSSPELDDVPLSTRVSRANKVYSNNPNTYMLSLHSNAGGGTGFEGFTSKGDTQSDPICEKFLQDLKKAFPDIPMRQDTSDGDLDKESDFYVLKRTAGPSILLELLFMDHKIDYVRLNNELFRDRVENCLVATIRKLYYGTN